MIIYLGRVCMLLWFSAKIILNGTQVRNKGMCPYRGGSNILLKSLLLLLFNIDVVVLIFLGTVLDMDSISITWEKYCFCYRSRYELHLHYVSSFHMNYDLLIGLQNWIYFELELITRHNDLLALTMTWDINL
jgi:hypothetical protein